MAIILRISLGAVIIHCLNRTEVLFEAVWGILIKIILFFRPEELIKCHIRCFTIATLLLLRNVLLSLPAKYCWTQSPFATMRFVTFSLTQVRQVVKIATDLFEFRKSSGLPRRHITAHRISFAQRRTYWINFFDNLPHLAQLRSALDLFPVYSDFSKLQHHITGLLPLLFHLLLVSRTRFGLIYRIPIWLVLNNFFGATSIIHVNSKSWVLRH